MATTPQSRVNRRGQPSLALPLGIIAVGTVIAIAVLLVLAGA